MSDAHVREQGTFTVSIDLEIAWRCCGDRMLTTELREGLRYEAEVVDRILALFARYDISATWAVVGHLLVDACSRDPGGRFHPEIPRPIVFGETRDWFFQHPDAVDADGVGFYARELVERIRNAHPPQEIGSHSFSHIPYAETMSHRAAVEADVRQASSLHAAAALPFASFVFPRNQVGHLDVLAQAGVRSFRGTPRLWYEALPSPARKLFSFASYFFATAPPTFRIRRDPSGLVNIPGSMLLMSRNGVRRLLSSDRLVQRARRGLRAAVRRGETFHLWFHPCNFTDRLEMMDEQFIVLERILAEAAALRQAGRLDILTMNQQADRLAARESRAAAQPESVAFHDERAGLFQDLYARSARQPLTNAFTCGRAHLAERLDAVLRALPPGSRVLDLGCGTGDHLRLFRARGLDVIGVEPSPAMRAIAQAKNADVPILDGTAQSIPLDDASVDFVLAIEVMRYLDEATCLQGYREILRVLKPGGTAFVTLVNRWALDGYTLFYKGQRLLSAFGFLQRPVHCEFVTPPQIRRQLVSIGAGSARTEGCLFAPLRIAYKIHPALGQTMSRLLYKVDSRLSNGPLTATAGHLICVFSR